MRVTPAGKATVGAASARKMPPTAMPTVSATAFIARWSPASPSKRVNNQLFLFDLCDLLGLHHPDASRKHGYAFEFPVPTWPTHS